MSTPWSFSYSQIDCAASLVALMKRYAVCQESIHNPNLLEYRVIYDVKISVVVYEAQGCQCCDRESE